MYQDLEWRPLFKKHSFKAESLLIPPIFLDYLDADGVVVDPDLCEEDDPLRLSEAFVAAIEASIQRIGGKGVVPRTNWNTPK